MRVGSQLPPRPSIATAEGGAYWILLVLSVLGAIYSVSWVVSDIIIRLSDTAAENFPAGMVAFVRQVHWAQETVFFSAVAISLLNIALIFRQSRWAVPGYATVLILIGMDWIASGWFGFEGTTVSGLRGIVTGAIALLLALWLHSRGVLCRRGF